MLPHRRRLDARALEYFIAVAEEGSFTLGARRVHIVQSAASQAVSRLEDILGVELFIRGSRGLQLTDAGRVLLSSAYRVRRELDAAHDEVAALQNGLGGAVRLGLAITTGTLDLFDVLRDYRRRHPGVTVSLVPASSSWSQYATTVLDDADLDLAIIPAPPPSTKLRVDAVAVSQLVLACSSQSRWADARHVTPAQLTGQEFVDYPAGWGNRQKADSYFARAGVARHVALEVVSAAQAVDAIRAEFGIGFIPIDRLGVPGIARIALRDELEPAVLAVVTSAARPTSPAAQQLRDMLVSAGTATTERATP